MFLSRCTDMANPERTLELPRSVKRCQRAKNDMCYFLGRPKTPKRRTSDATFAGYNIIACPWHQLITNTGLKKSQSIAWRLTISAVTLLVKGRNSTLRDDWMTTCTFKRLCQKVMKRIASDVGLALHRYERRIVSKTPEMKTS